MMGNVKRVLFRMWSFRQQFSFEPSHGRTGSRPRLGLSKWLLVSSFATMAPWRLPMNFSRISLSIAAFTLLCTGALAQDKGTRAEAKAMVDRAHEHAKKVGADQAFKDFSTDKANWTHKDLYVFATSMDGVMLANGANERLVGKNLLDLKDQNGKLFVQEYLSAAKANGSAWTDYDWTHPQTKKLEAKTSYVRKLDNFSAVVGVGVYR